MTFEYPQGTQVDRSPGLDPGVPVRSARAAVRGRILAELREAADNLRLRVSVWTEGRRFYPGDGTQYSHPGVRWKESWRWSTWEEFPENDPGTLLREARRLHQLGNQLIGLARRLDEEHLAAKVAAFERAKEAEERSPKV